MARRGFPTKSGESSRDQDRPSGGRTFVPFRRRRRGGARLDNLTAQAYEGQGNTDASLTPTEKHRIAQRGFSDTPGPLPYLDTIQRAFGHHAVKDIRSFIGGAASSSSDSLDASAYCVGDRIAFDRPPDLYTAAHEAAHVVQQRSDLTLSGGVGHREDSHEEHADKVANAVVHGQSAESLLSEYAKGRSSESHQLQLQERNPNAESYQAQHPNFVPRSYPQPEGAGVAAQGRCDLSTGILTWALAPRVGYVNARIEFIPNATVAGAHPTISYIQTVSSSIFNPRGESEVDVLSTDTDPFYGARWDETKKQWVDEPRSTQHRDLAIDDMTAPQEGSRPYTATTGSAVLNDSPFLNIGEVKYFETAVVVVDTGEVLGSLSWTILRFEAGFVPAFVNRWLGRKQPTSTIARNVVCKPGASPEFDAALKRYYAEHPDAMGSEGGATPSKP